MTISPLFAFGSSVPHAPFTQTHVDNSFGRSLAFTHSNVLGTHVMLEAARRHMPTLRRFIHVSTDEIYGENKDGAIFLEGLSSYDPTNPYEKRGFLPP